MLFKSDSKVRKQGWKEDVTQSPEEALFTEDGALMHALPHVSDEFERHLSNAFEETVGKELLRRHALVHEPEKPKKVKESPKSSPKASPKKEHKKEEKKKDEKEDPAHSKEKHDKEHKATSPEGAGKKEHKPSKNNEEAGHTKDNPTKDHSPILSKPEETKA